MFDRKKKTKEKEIKRDQVCSSKQRERDREAQRENESIFSSTNTGSDIKNEVKHDKK